MSQEQKNKNSRRSFIRLVASTISCVLILSVLFLSGCKKDHNELYNLYLTVNPEGAGTVTADTVAEDGYAAGTIVNLSVQPALSYYFTEWSGDATGKDNPLKVEMNSNKEIEAGFSEGFYEDFEDDNADFFITEGSSCWDVADTVYIMTGSNDEGARRYSCYNYNQIDNFEFSADLRGDPNGYDYGIYFRSQTANPFKGGYILSIIPGGNWLLYKWIDDIPYSVQDYTSSANLKTENGSTNNIKVKCSGASIEVIFNNVSLGTYTDTEFSSGYAGVWGSDLTKKCIFDDLFLKGI